MSDLPEVIAEIAEVAGLDAAWTIAIAKGGQQVFIPASASDDHWLTHLVGIEAASKICERFRAGHRGDKLLIPMASNARRRRAWADAIAANRSVNETAAALGVHRRSVFRHLAAPKTDPDQGDLF